MNDNNNVWSCFVDTFHSSSFWLGFVGFVGGLTFEHVVGAVGVLVVVGAFLRDWYYAHKKHKREEARHALVMEDEKAVRRSMERG